MTQQVTPSYKVKVKIKNQPQPQSYLNDAYLTPATKTDMPSNWSFDWSNFWKKADFDCEAIIKLSYERELLGLVRFALYPFYGDNRPPKYLEILHLECVPQEKRIVTPVGYWLLWYAFEISFKYCIGESDGTLIRLDSVESAIDYYEKKVKMTGLGWTNYPGGEELYAFSFDKPSAQEFCFRLKTKYGNPILQ